MELALEAGVSTRHLSFVETGRSRPSAEMVLHLAEQLEVPLRERNELLLAAGLRAAILGARASTIPSCGQVRDAVGHVLAGHEPYPAIAVDRYWNLHRLQRARWARCWRACARAAGAAGQHASGSRCTPTGSRRGSSTSASGRATSSSAWTGRLGSPGDPRLAELHEEMLGYPGERDWSPAAPVDAAVMVGTAAGAGARLRRRRADVLQHDHHVRDRGRRHGLRARRSRRSSRPTRDRRQLRGDYRRAGGADPRP